MDTRDESRAGVRQEPDLVVSDAPAAPAADRPRLHDDRPVLLHREDADGDPLRAPSPRLAVLLGAGVALVLAATVALAFWTSGGDDDVTAGSTTPGAEGSDVPAALGMSVDPAARVVAGEEATLTVRWTDGAGIFSGTSEEWGDGIGTSSLSQDRCEPGAPAAEAAGGTYTVTHTWSEPGTYTVVLGVATYVCDNGSAVQEQVTEPVTVEVLPAG
jgi:hypothetical protein